MHMSYKDLEDNDSFGPYPQIIDHVSQQLGRVRNGWIRNVDFFFDLDKSKTFHISIEGTTLEIRHNAGRLSKERTTLDIAHPESIQQLDTMVQEFKQWEPLLAFQASSAESSKKQAESTNGLQQQDTTKSAFVTQIANTTSTSMQKSTAPKFGHSTYQRSLNLT